MVHCCAVLVTIEYPEPSVIHICIVYTLIAAAAAAARLRIPHLTPQTTRPAAAPHLAPQTTREADSSLVCILGTCSPKHDRNRRQPAELARTQLKNA